MKLVNMTDEVSKFIVFLENQNVKPGENIDEWVLRLHSTIGKVCGSITSIDSLGLARNIGVAFWDIAVFVYVTNKGNLHPFLSSLVRMNGVRKWSNDPIVIQGSKLVNAAVRTIALGQSRTGKYTDKCEIELTTLTYRLASVARTNGLVVDRVIKNGRETWVKEQNKGDFLSYLELHKTVKG